MLKKSLLLVLILGISVSMCFAGSGTALTASSNMKFGARPQGLGGAFTGVSGDLNSVFYNPAGLASINRFSFLTSYSNPYQLTWMKNTFVGVAFPTGNLVHAITFINNNIEYEYDSSFGFDDLSWTERRIGYSVGLKLNKYNYFGLNFGYNQITNNVQANGKGYSFDAGYLIKTNENFSFGISARNIYYRKKYDSGSDEDQPLEYSFGADYDFSKFLKLVGDLNGSEDENLTSMNFGAEINIWDAIKSSYTGDLNKYFKNKQSVDYPIDVTFKLRAGIDKSFVGDKNINYSFGATFKVGPTKLDYALRIDNDELENTHYFSLGMNFGKPKEEEVEPENVEQTLPYDTNQYRNQNIPMPPVVNVSKKITVALVDFKNIGTLDNKNQWISTGIPDMLIMSLKRNNTYNIKDRKEISNMFKMLNVDVSKMNPVSASQLGILVNSDYIVIGTYNVDANNIITINYSIYNTDHQRLVFQDVKQGSVPQLLFLLNSIGDNVNKILSSSR